MIHKLIPALFFLFTSSLFAGGIRGTIITDTSEPLAYATIYVKETETGTTSNEDGYFEFSLRPGKYTVIFQYLGYESQVKEFTIGNDYQVINITLKPQVTVLRTVTVRAGQEDPAYTIMRKAIAKANYHNNLLDAYSARVYIKGAGKLLDYPWLAKSALEKEGVEKGRVFISESVSEIKYTRPNKFEERVISIHSDGKDNNTSPNTFIFGSFYQPEVAGVISPLSPKAFSYYKFEYLGTFKDRDYAISTIKVTPRSKGDDVVTGTLNIVEDWWSIHSIDMSTVKMGIRIKMKSMYAPIEEKVWLPVSFQFNVYGDIMGFEFDYNYLSSLSNYIIQLNPEIYVESTKMEVIDEKIEQEQAKVIRNANPDADKLKERLASGKEITRKELKTLIKDYEKEERKALKEPEVVMDYTHKIDSGAMTKDSVYWALLRPIPLTHEEIVGYQKTDSLAEVQHKRDEGDTLKQSKHKGFQPWDLLIGDNYSLGKHTDLKIHFPGLGFNTVDGYYFNYRLTLGIKLQDTNKTAFSISPVVRYGFSRKKVNTHLTFKLENKKYQFKLDGGSYIRQYNPEEPIWPIVNTFTTLLLEKNLMKIYEREYVDLFYLRKISPYFSWSTNWTWANRTELFNTSNHKWINNGDIEDYTPNRPVNLELPDTGFDPNRAFTGSLTLTARPWMKFRVNNGQRQEIRDSSPTFNFTYRRGFANILNSDVDFDLIDARIRHGFKVGVRGRVDVAAQAGVFLNNNKMYFMDYKHFLGNQTPFSTTDPIGSFRLLDYYLYSTADRYFITNVHYHFRKFLLTTIPIVRMTGIRENIFVNYLATPTSQNFTELGYSIDGIFRLFRLEAVTSFQDGKYLSYGFRIGIATSLQVKFNDN